MDRRRSRTIASVDAKRAKQLRSRDSDFDPVVAQQNHLEDGFNDRRAGGM